MAMLSDKLRNILDAGAEVCAAADNSCLMHIGGALHRQRAGVRTVHIAEILASTEERSLVCAKLSPLHRQRTHYPRFKSQRNRRLPTPSYAAICTRQPTPFAPNARRSSAKCQIGRNFGRRAGRSKSEYCATSIPTCWNLKPRCSELAVISIGRVMRKKPMRSLRG